MFKHYSINTQTSPPPLVFKVFGTFPKAFSQGRLTKYQFPKWQLPKCAISQAATFHSQAPRLEQAGGRALRLGQTYEIAAWEVVHLESCHLGKYPWEVDAWENAFGKMPNIVFTAPVKLYFSLLIKYPPSPFI